jgi:hypothetical protein
MAFPRRTGRLAVLAVLVVLVGVGVALGRRPPAGSARPPAPPAAGQHGDLGYQAVAGQGSIGFDLRVAADGTFRFHATEIGRPEVARSGRLPDADRTALAGLVGAACRERLLPAYVGDTADAGRVTLTLPIQLHADPESAPAEIDRLQTWFWSFCRRLAG